MNCIIVDDEETARIILEQLCSKSPNLVVQGSFSNAMSAMKYLNQNKVDLIFLDINMPDFTGFDFIQTLKVLPRIIITTSHKDYAIEAFEYNCIVDYLVKPIKLPRFIKAVEKAEAFKLEAPAQSTVKSDTETTGSELFVNIDRRLIKIDMPSITVIEAKGDYITVRTVDKNYTVHSTLKKIEEKLPTETFLKVHRSYIINTHKIVDIEDNSVLIGKSVIPVSRSKRPELMRRLNLL
ncbi:LytR/AlgR family response regulator transcription factor [Ulvibacter litoralis]|uniref:DNA-binding response regulator, LytR/AlgR family n=1 Tax=Ulvibacter litoralis TaxID=227084 RepID=A0A1G7CK16_9FLAO|nr:LytTR family DNA-binding domain-containing protein [Ulvibacter litoralis]GHC47060.1 DNA-binding response regulator [Ulvibacter litoralis]SDE39659.1 DNA-binding response regulator, LytR/AlgR family [Ulvibacter litoralis]